MAAKGGAGNFYGVFFRGREKTPSHTQNRTILAEKIMRVQTGVVIEGAATWKKEYAYGGEEDIDARKGVRHPCFGKKPLLCRRGPGLPLQHKEKRKPLV